MVSLPLKYKIEIEASFTFGQFPTIGRLAPAIDKGFGDLKGSIERSINTGFDFKLIGITEVDNKELQ